MKSLISQRDILRDIRDGVATWTKVANSNIPVFNLYNYQPLCCHNEERLKIREFIDDFMNGINLENVASQVETVLKHFFKKKTLSTLVFFSIPDSIDDEDLEKWELFSSCVASKCDMWNGNNYINYDNYVSKDDIEYVDILTFNKQGFKDKNIIIFVTIDLQRNLINNMTCKFNRFGGNVIGAITLIGPSYEPGAKEPYDEMDKSIKHQLNNPSWPSISYSDRESARLFKIYKDVPSVANVRQLAIGTIYSHLFSIGLLSPDNFINEEKYDRACKIYESGRFDNPSLHLDYFLDDAGKAAFFFIRQYS